MDRQANTAPLESIDQLKFRGHIPALDGLRGVAVLMVLMLHFYLSEAEILRVHPTFGPILGKIAFSGVWGVELFFVLSGFLITGILVDSKDKINYFGAFYMRRFLRIFPLYYVTLAVVLLILPNLVAFDAPAQSIVSRQVWLWTYLQNTPWSGGHWDDSTIFHMVHFWSLCVEEHYYLVWPLVVRFLPARYISVVCIVGMVSCLALRMLHSVPGSPTILGWSTLTKLDGLFVGSLIALGCRAVQINKSFKKFAPIGLVVFGIAFAALLFIPRRVQLGYYGAFVEPVVVLFFGSVLITALDSANGFSKLLRNPFLRTFGKYSYGIYVIHFLCVPAFDSLFQRRNMCNWTGSPLLVQVGFYVLTIASSYLLAFTSWHLMEKHFLTLKEHFEYRSAPV